MDSNSKLRRAVTVMFIISLALIALFAGSYLFSLWAYNLNGGNFGAALFSDVKLLGQAFTYLFNPKGSTELLAFYGSQVALVLSIVTYVVSGLILVLLILALVYILRKKKPLHLLYGLAILASLIIACIIIILSGCRYLNLAGAPRKIAKVAGIAVFALGVLAFLAVNTTAILGLINLGKRPEEIQVAEPTEPATIAEAAGDPEAVQEGEELLVNQNEILVESEPEPVPEETPEDMPVPEEEIPNEEPHVVEEPKEDKQHVEVNVNSGAGMDNASLATLLREVVRDIVRDEIARNNLNQPQQNPSSPNGNQTITGATFGGPLVVQYFNGGINGVNPPSPVVAPAPVESKPAEVKEAKAEQKQEVQKAEPVKEEKPAPRPLFVKKEVKEEKPAEAPASQPKVVSTPEEPKEEKKYERLTFAERLLQSDDELHQLYNELKNEILSYGVKSRVSAVGDTFRLHKKMYVRITVAGKSLKLYFALNPADYANSTLPIQDASEKEMYQEIPLVFKVKSPLSVRRCKELIQDVMEKDGLEQGEVGKVNWIKELKAELANEAKK